ncbi:MULTISPECIES: hypothetical protein [unclassified Streptomyces]|uniref:hypothetical protein n=1 Tax=unclassified Streptomyces TaxID=2593676 RepID=UPI0019062E00|nr:hypothetical protein [Streptomyces sp. HSG2]
MSPATNPTISLHANPGDGSVPPLWFLTPEGFHSLPLGASPEERGERSRAFVRDLYSRGSEEIWAPAALHYANLAGLLQDTGVSYAAVGLFSTAADDGASSPGPGTTRGETSKGVAQCALTVAVVATEQSTAVDGDAVAQGILATLSSDPLNDAIWLDLPCGPAVSCISMREHTVGAEVSASGEPTKLVTGQVQVHIPFPADPFVAVFTLDTASLDHWPEFYRALSSILRTVAFTDPESARDGEEERPR